MMLSKSRNYPNMIRRLLILLWIGFLLFFFQIEICSANELVLLKDGKSEYQIVLPDQFPSEAIARSLNQTARLIKTAFQASGAEVSIVEEGLRKTTQPSIFLGNTQFARQHNIDCSQLKDWSYVHRAIGRDLVIAGHDHAARGVSDNSLRPNWDRIGTSKATVDFLREYMGVRFLFPEIGSYTPVAGAERIELIDSPAIEFLPVKSAVVPADLNVKKIPILRANTSHPAGGGFYDLALNRFPRVDEMFGGHTWERAIPHDEYWESHPEYFALINGTRLKPTSGGAQYCLSNADVQELIYRDCARWAEQGYSRVDLGQPDGFRPCQCPNCSDLFNTGSDWSEKIWLFNKQIAERMLQSHPDAEISMMSYIQTSLPPRTFDAFPSNTSIMLTGTNEQDIAPWLDIDVPKGFTGYIYNWCPNLATRYTPMRTPGFVESQAKRLAANGIQSLHRDGPGQLFGLEGPVYYVMGRMFDEPQKNAARDLLTEFYEAAFVDKSTIFYMRSFYDRLFHAISIYSDLIGTRCDYWSIPLMQDERPRKTVQDAFALVAFLYPPATLADLESDLSQAEKQARSKKVKTRLALIRSEFDYLRHFAKVVHLHQAYRIQPDAPSRNRLLDSIDARNAFIDSLYDPKRIEAATKSWSHVMFPFPGHNSNHLRLAYDRYQEPYANTCFNWDTAKLRESTEAALKELAVQSSFETLSLDSPEWETATAHNLSLVEPLRSLPLETIMRLKWDAENLYIHADCELPPGNGTEFPLISRDRILTTHESFEVLLQPEPSREVTYRLRVGPNSASRFDAAAGLISDQIDPRFGKDDPDWNGNWSASSRVDTESGRWLVMITIPFSTLSVAPPAIGARWRANFGRNHSLPRGQVDRSVWSASSISQDVSDREILGQIQFE